VTRIFRKAKPSLGGERKMFEVIISVGYRVKSHQGVHFRKWATALIKEYLIKGFAMNDENFAHCFFALIPHH
jgi:hypothetical protein